MAPLKRLFEPIKIGNLELKNRIKMPAMAVVPAEAEDVVINRLKAFYVERAKGGVAIIGTSCTATDLIQAPMLGLHDDRFIDGLRELTEATVVEITDKGVKISQASSTEFVEADTVVLAGGLEPNSRLAEELSGRDPVVYPIGDCAQPGKLLEAIASGFLIGQQI